MKNPFRQYEKDMVMNSSPLEQNKILFFTSILDLYCSRFKWNGLPDYIPDWFIEKTLFYHSLCAMIFDKDLGDNGMYAIMKCNLSGMPDIYNVPEIRNVYAPNLYIEGYTKENSVILWDNTSHIPFYYKALKYSEMFSEIWETVRINLKNQKTPRIIKTSENDKLSYQIVGENVDKYVQTVTVDDSFNLDNISVLDLTAPYLGDKLLSLLNALWSDLLTQLGIDSNPVQKKERLISSETSGNVGRAEQWRNIELGYRERFCEQCNKLWGLDLSVEFNSDIDLVPPMQEFNQTKNDLMGSEEDGK